MDHETALVNAFVLPERRARLAEMLRTRRGREKVLASLYHFRGLDPRFAVAIPTTDHTPSAIRALLAARGAPTSCHVISTNRDLDGREVNLGVALAGIVGTGDGSLVSCIPGCLGYFEDESSRFILARGLP
jgi:hypothetical protein